MLSRILTSTTAQRTIALRATASTTLNASSNAGGVTSYPSAAFSSKASSSSTAGSSASYAAIAAAFAATVAAASASTTALCDFGGEEHKETATGITFPAQVDGLPFAGAGVRVKYGFVKVYAVGTYANTAGIADMDAFMGPAVDKTIRIVMNRGLSVDKFTAAISEALEPRMNGKDLEKLDEFKTLNPPGALLEGAEIIMSLKGDTMYYRSSFGGQGSIKSAVFVAALNDVYFGKSAVSGPQRDMIAKSLGN